MGFELADSGTCRRPSLQKVWRIALAFRELIAQVLRPTALSGMPCLCLDYDASYTACSVNELSRPWDTTVHAADASVSALGVAALTAPLTVEKNVRSISERWRIQKGRCVQRRNLAALWTKSTRAVFPVVHANCVVSVLLLMTEFVTGGSR